jgi:hypothetical protein
MEVRQLQASRLGNEASLWLDPGGVGNASEGGLGPEANFDGPVSDFGNHGSESDVDRAVLRVATIGAGLSRRIVGEGD